MAVVEVVTNSIEHAYPPGDQGPLEFDLALQPDGDLDCRVADYGRLAAAGPGRYRPGQRPDGRPAHGR